MRIYAFAGWQREWRAVPHQQEERSSIWTECASHESGIRITIHSPSSSSSSHAILGSRITDHHRLTKSSASHVHAQCSCTLTIDSRESSVPSFSLPISISPGEESAGSELAVNCKWWSCGTCTGYLSAAYEIVRKAGGLSLQMKNRRVLVGPVPTTGDSRIRGIGNGLPLAAVVTTPEITGVLSQRLHFNTYGGNPVCSAAAGHAVLEVLDKEKGQEHYASVGGPSPAPPWSSSR